MLLVVATCTSTIFSNAIVIFTSTINLLFVVLFPLSFNMFYISLNFGQVVSLYSMIPKIWQVNGLRRFATYALIFAITIVGFFFLISTFYHIVVNVVVIDVVRTWLNYCSLTCSYHVVLDTWDVEKKSCVSWSTIPSSHNMADYFVATMFLSSSLWLQYKNMITIQIWKYWLGNC